MSGERSFTLTIDTHNADEDIAAMVAKVAESVTHHQDFGSPSVVGWVVDANGNSVGQWELTWTEDEDS